MKTESRIAKLRGKAQFGAALALCLFIAHPAQAAYDFWAGVPGVSTTINWTDAANWTSAVQTYYNEVEFTGVGANANSDVSVNNVLDGTTGVSQMPIWELDYIPTNGNYTTLINPGVTLTLNAGRGYLVVGADQLNTANPAPANAIETITITGSGGTLSMVGNLYVNQGSPQPGDVHNVTLDLSGLDTFIDNGPSGSQNNSILVASGGAPRTHGTLYLAKTNQITLGNDFEICNQSYSNSMPCAVYLGRTNMITLGAGNLIVAGSGATTVGAWMKFNPAFIGGANPVPTAYFNSTRTDGRIANFWICNGNGGPNVPGYGLCDFSSGNITMLVDTMQLGQAGTASALGVLTFDDGVIDVNNVAVGNQEVSSGGAGVGIININKNTSLGTNATLQVNNTLTLAAVTGGLTPGTAGTININGGKLAANNIVNGTGIGTINLTNGTLTMTGVAGTPTAPITTLSITNSVLNLPVISGSNSVAAASLRTGGTTNIINIVSAPPFASYPVQITLIKYNGSIGGAGFNFGLGSLPPLYVGHLLNNTANSSIDLVLTSGSGTLTWVGNINGNWDTTTANWQAGGSTTYADGEFVQFLDGASIGAVNLTTTLSPGSVTVSNSVLNYTFNGAGSLGGSGSLLKTGSGELLIDNSGVNNFSGGLTINDGTLQVGNNDSAGSLPPGSIVNNGNLVFARSGNVTVGNNISGTGSFVQAGSGGTLLLSGTSSFSGSVIVTNNSTLQGGSASALGSGSGSLIIANGSTFDANGNASPKSIVVSGSGVGGNGAITDSGNPVYGLATNVTLAGDATFNYPNRWDLQNVLSTSGNAYNLTLNGNGNYFEWRNLAVDPALGNINLASGSLGIVGSTTLGNPNATLTLASGAALVLYGGPNSRVSKGVDFQSGAAINNYGGDNVMSGTMTLEPGYCSFNISGGTSLTISNTLSGSGIIYQNGGMGPVILSGNSPSFTGGVSLYTGETVLNGAIGSGITSQLGTIVAGSGTAGGLVDVSGALLPGDAGQPGTFHAQGGLVLESGAVLTNDLNTLPSGNNDLIQVTGDLTVNGNSIYINPIGGSLANAAYTLITYTGNLNGSFGVVSTISPTGYTLVLTNVTTTTPKQIQVIVTGGSSGALVWNNASGNGEWDVQSSANWSNLVTHASPVQFLSLDSVLFSNSASASTNIDIASGQLVIPSLMTVNSSLNYTIHGAGQIGGAASIVKQGSGALTISNANAFTGGVTISGGTLVAAANSALGSTNGTITITNGGTLDMSYALGSKPVLVSGAGVGGNGAIVDNSGQPIYSPSGGPASSITLLGDTTFGGNTRWDLGAYGSPGGVLSSGGKPYNLTIAGSFGYFQWVNLAVDTNLADINLTTAETFGIVGATTLGNPTNTLNIFPSASVVLYNDGSQNVLVNKKVRLYNNASLQNGGGSNVVISPVVLGTNAGDNCVFNIGGTSLTISNVISGMGNLVKSGSGSPLYLVAANTYTGNTVVSNGTLALIGAGSILSSPNINVLSGQTLDVSGRTDQTLTLATGQILQGSGAINGNLTVGSGAIVSPGGPGALGTLAISGTVNLSGAAVMEVNKIAGTRDQISTTGSINYGGTLVVTNLIGAFATNDSFKLFSGGSYNGAFAAVVPATPGSGLVWDTSSLTTDGTLRVVGGAVPPTIGTIKLSGGNIVISGANNTGSGGTYHVLTSTNLALPRASWTVLTNGTFDSNGNFSFTNAVGGKSQQFYLLQVP